MKRQFLSLFVPVLVAIAAQNAAAVLMTFDELPLNHTYNVGNSFTTPLLGIPIQVQPFSPVIGEPITNGTLKVDDFMYAGGMGRELAIKKVNLKFLLNFNSCPDCGIALLFYDMQGDVNLRINDGDVRKAADFTALRGTIDGAQVFVDGVYPFGVIRIIGSNIQSFTIGGQALYIDHVLAYGYTAVPVPEPTTIVLLGLGSLGLLMSRKKA